MAFPSFVHLVWYLLVISRLHILSVPIARCEYGQLYVLNDTQRGILLL